MSGGSGAPSVLAALASAGAPADVALRRGAATLTRAALLAAIDRLAGELSRLGLRAGDPIGVRAAEPFDFVALALAVRAAGGVPCPLAPDAVPDAALAKLAVLERRGAHAGAAAGVTASGAGGGEATLRLDVRGDGAPLPEGTTWLRATSGSSGDARLVAADEACALATARRCGALLDAAPGTAVVTTLPPWTSYGWNVGVLGTLLAGAEAHLVSPLAPRDLLAPLHAGAARWAVTTAPVVRALARLAASVPSSGAPRGRVLVSSAAYPDRDAAEVRARHGLSVLDRYGATEAGPIAQATEPGGPLFPAPGVEVTVEDGLAVVRSDGVGLGVLGEPPFGGVFRTADRVALLPGGGFRLEGRADRVVRRAGRPVDLARVEAALAALPGVALARVRTEPGRYDLDLAADVVPADGAMLDGATLLAELASRLPPWERPRLIAVRATADDGKWTTA